MKHEITDAMVERGMAAHCCSNPECIRKVLEAALNPPDDGWLTQAQLKAGCDAVKLDHTQLVAINHVVDIVAAVVGAGPIKPPQWGRSWVANADVLEAEMKKTTKMRAEADAAIMPEPEISDAVCQLALDAWGITVSNPDYSGVRRAISAAVLALKALEPKRPLSTGYYQRKYQGLVRDERFAPPERREHGHRGMEGNIETYRGPFRRKAVDWPPDGWGRRDYDKRRSGDPK